MTSLSLGLDDDDSSTTSTNAGDSFYDCAADCSSTTNVSIRTTGDVEVDKNQPLVVDSDFLVYPMNFFTDMGCVPKHDNCISIRWKYRSSRPKDPSAIDSVPVNLKIMRQEMTEMRKDLFNFALFEYTNHSKTVANEQGLTFAPGEQKIVRNSDLKASIHQLEKTACNEEKLYYIFHHRMRQDKAWHLSIVDQWAASRKIHLLPVDSEVINSEEKKKIRVHAIKRMGFSGICLEARRRMLQNYMRSMFNKCGWMIASTNKEKRQKGETKRMYTVRQIKKDDGSKLVFYLVEKRKDVSLTLIPAESFR